MKQFSIRALLIVVALSAIAVWYFNDNSGVIFRETSDKHGELKIFGQRDRDSDQYRIRIQFTPINATQDEIHQSYAILLRKPVKEKLEFFSRVDKASGTWLVCDRNEQDLVILILEKPATVADRFRQIWHPGVHIGWLRGMWAKYFREIKANNKDIPYNALPYELRIDYKSKKQS